jgi:hypothetical protein
MPPDDYAAHSVMVAELNKVILKLGETGIHLHGGFKWKMVGEPYWNPTGFDFWCCDFQRLQNMADSNPKLAVDSADMPGYDPWQHGNVLSVGFTQVGPPPRVHLDIALEPQGLCRIYIETRDVMVKRDAMGMAKIASAKDTDVYRKITARLGGVSPPIDLDDHIGGKLQAERTTLDGIDFEPENYPRLLQALRDAKDSSGKDAFAEGGKSRREHWPLSMSFLATKGVGFRQIWRPSPSDRPLSTPNQGDNQPAADPRYSARFGDNMNLPDLSALHCGVSKYGCNIHIDEMGFVMEDAYGNVIVDPDFLRHALVELVWKTNLKGTLPLWALDRVSFDIMSSPQDFSRAGVSIDLIQSDRYKLTLRGSCGVSDDFEASGTLTFSGRF